jgi:methionyl-tRNA formyltransferase
VVSYGQLLKKPLLELPRFGCVNIHASLLPKYRGASPITRAIVNGDEKTGVAFMDMEVGLDCGKVYYTIERQLDKSEYADALEVELGSMAAEKTLEVLEKIASGALAGVPQDESLVSMTTKLKKSDGVINWLRPAVEIEASVRAYYPWPGATFALELNGEIRNLTVTGAKVVANPDNAPAGTVIKADRKGWVVACGRDALEIVEVLPPGKKSMPGANYLNGCREPLLGKQLITG